MVPTSFPSLVLVLLIFAVECSEVVVFFHFLHLIADKAVHEMATYRVRDNIRSAIIFYHQTRLIVGRSMIWAII